MFTIGCAILIILGRLIFQVVPLNATISQLSATSRWKRSLHEPVESCSRKQLHILLRILYSKSASFFLPGASCDRHSVFSERSFRISKASLIYRILPAAGNAPERTLFRLALFNYITVLLINKAVVSFRPRRIMRRAEESLACGFYDLSTTIGMTRWNVPAHRQIQLAYHGIEPQYTRSRTKNTSYNSPNSPARSSSPWPRRVADHPLRTPGPVAPANNRSRFLN